MFKIHLPCFNYYFYQIKMKILYKNLYKLLASRTAQKLQFPVQHIHFLLWNWFTFLHEIKRNVPKYKSDHCLK